MNFEMDDSLLKKIESFVVGKKINTDEEKSQAISLYLDCLKNIFEKQEFYYKNRNDFLNTIVAKNLDGIDNYFYLSNFNFNSDCISPLSLSLLNSLKNMIDQQIYCSCCKECNSLINTYLLTNKIDLEERNDMFDALDAAKKNCGQKCMADVLKKILSNIKVI